MDCHSMFFVRLYQTFMWKCVKNSLGIVVAGPKQSCPSIIYHHLPFVKGISSNLSINQPTNGSLGHLSHRIHGAGIYAVPWIPSTYPIHVSIYIPAPWIRHGNTDIIPFFIFDIWHSHVYPMFILLSQTMNQYYDHKWDFYTSMVKRVPSRGQDGSVRDVAGFHHLRPVACPKGQQKPGWRGFRVNL